MKSMRLPLVAIFFMTNFYRAGGHGPLVPPWIRYWYKSLPDATWQWYHRDSNSDSTALLNDAHHPCNTSRSGHYIIICITSCCTHLQVRTGFFFRAFTYLTRRLLLKWILMITYESGVELCCLCSTSANLHGERKDLVTWKFKFFHFHCEGFLLQE